MSPTNPNPALPGMDQALRDQLERQVPGGVRSRASDRLAYAHDASHYLYTPKAVVTARSVEDVGALMKGSGRHGVPLTFRSGGTSLSGQASSDGILVDTRRNFRKIEILANGLRARVEPGATVRQLNMRLARHGRKFGPDPASEAACTIGGVIANNSSGMTCGTHANAYRTIESAVLVMPSGATIDTAKPDADSLLADREPELYAGLLELRDTIRLNPGHVAEIRRMHSIKNTMGYGLNAFLDFDRVVDILLHLAVGSEGTLAFVGEATFRTVPIMPCTATEVLFFKNLREATAALPALVEAGFAAIELLDSTSLRVAQRDPQADDQLRTLEVLDHAALLVEFQESTVEDLSRRVNDSEPMLASLPLVAPARMSSDPRRRAALWHIRKGLYATVAGNRPPGTTALLEDIAVPVDKLLPTCAGLVALFEEYGYQDAVIFGHAKDGNIHFLLNERFDAESPYNTLDRYRRFTDAMIDLVLEHGGTLKAEHGTGRIMAPFVRRQYGDELFAIMAEVKKLCDPQGVLSPGVLLNDDPESHIANLKTAPIVEEEVDRCVECGYCEPVCPSKDLTLTPRQRIVLRREAARAAQQGNEALRRELEEEYRYDGLETCAADGMCQTACPVLIDTGELVKRLRAETARPLEQKAWKTASDHWGTVAMVGGLALSSAKMLPAPFVTATSELARRVLSADAVPRWDKDLPSGGKRRRAREDQDPKAVYLSACITTMFGPGGSGPGVASSFLNLCGRAGIQLVTPEGVADLCCGTPWKSKGMLEGYDLMRQQVVPAVWEASQHGKLPIVCDAASCTEGLERLLSAIENDPKFRVVDAVEFVDQHVLPALPAGEKIRSLALHPTCSTTRLGINPALSRIAAAVAEEVVIPDDWGCCAFAGDRGMLHPELTASATASEASALSGRTFDAYASANRTCELGMARATGKPYQHILELLDSVTAASPVGEKDGRANTKDLSK